MFKKRAGTAGVSGHLYETKLLSLLYFRAIHDDRITEFHLASNVDDVGAFDDICFKATVDVEGLSKPVFVYIQAKHRENKNQTLPIDLITYYNSYLKIRQHFVPNNKELLFAGKFEETECLYVIYTTATAGDEFSNDSKVKSSCCSILNDLINTGGPAMQHSNQKQDVEFLCSIVFKDQITSLAKLIAEFIMDEKDFQQMLNNSNENIMLRYHVILAQKVLLISEIQSNGHRNATFRPEFFDTNEEYLTLFRDKLYKEIVNKRGQKKEIVKKIGQLKENKGEEEELENKGEEEVDNKGEEEVKNKGDEVKNIEKLLNEFIANPTDAKKLSKLIGTVITYNNGMLGINQQYAKYLRLQIVQDRVSRLTIDKAVELAAKEILLSIEFKVPAAFGNKDIKCKEKKIGQLTSKIIDLLNKYKSSKMVIIDESLEDGFLQLNKGGIAGAVGNIFVLDDNTKLMKITDNEDGLGTNARSLYENLIKEIGLMNEKTLINEIPNLSEYKFCFKGNMFPKLLLEFCEHEKNLAKDFLDKLLIYPNQADEKSVEGKLKDEIEEILEYNVYIKAKTNAMFLNYHNKIQKWWMLQKQAPYLTKNDQMFEKSTSYIIEDPLMISISERFIRKIKQYNYTFTEDAVRSLNLQDQHLSTFIVAEYSVLTIVKVMQHLDNKDHAVLDLEDIINLPTNERNALRIELTNTNKEKVLILVCNKIQKSGVEKKTLENVAEAVRTKKTIIITNDSSVEILQTYFATTDNNIVRDEKNSLMDMNEECQMSILKSARVKFQGIEVGLGHLLDRFHIKATLEAGQSRDRRAAVAQSEFHIINRRDRRAANPRLRPDRRSHRFRSIGDEPVLQKCRSTNSI